MVEESDSNANLRKIAIVLASLDADAAQQLILQLPTEMATQVRALVCTLDEVSPCETETVLQEFEALFADEPRAQTCSLTSNVSSESVTQGTSDRSKVAQSENSWDTLPTDVVASMVAGESPLLIATLVSELDAYNASDLLSHLPAHRSCEVLRALKHLHEVDAGQRTQIEQRLAHKFNEAEIRSKRGQQYDRQLSALVEAAPEELQQVWRTAIDKESSDNTSWPAADAPSQVFRGFESSHTSEPMASLPNTSNPPSDQTAPEDLGDLLNLPRNLLEELFANLSPETTLLCLAGAEPEFMNEFYSILQADDAAELRKRLHKLSGVRLRDMDEARTIVLGEASRLAYQYQSLASAAS